MKKKEINGYNAELERRDNVNYAKEVMGDREHFRNPENIEIELQRRILHSQTPKWINITMLILVTLTLIISALSLLHSYNLF